MPQRNSARIAPVRPLVGLLSLILLGPSLGHASIVLNSVFDDPGPVNVGTIIGMGVFGSNVDLFSSSTYYTSPLYNGSLTFTPSPGVYFPALGVHLNAQSLLAADPTDSNQAILSGGVLPPTIYTFQMTPPAQSSVFIAAGFKPTGLLIDNTGAEYLTRSNDSINGILKYASPSDTTPELEFGNAGTGALTQPTALAQGADGLIYVLDAGTDDIESFDASGNFVSEFALVDTPDSVTLAVGPNGWLYTANGNGGGDIYDTHTGTWLGTFNASTTYCSTVGASSPPGCVGNANYDTGHTVLLADGNNLYLSDANTGIHVFDIPTPEPATWTMLLAAAGALALARRRVMR
jgi:hypothetical protein